MELINIMTKKSCIIKLTNKLTARNDGKLKFLCLTKHRAMKTYWGNAVIVPCILNLSARWR